jgi:hypothetical protein
MAIRKTQMMEDNPLDRFKPDDDFDFSEETMDNPETTDNPEPQLSFSEWLWSKTPPAPDVWRTSGDREALKWCKDNFGLCDRKRRKLLFKVLEENIIGWWD